MRNVHYTLEEVARWFSPKRRAYIEHFGRQQFAYDMATILFENIVRLIRAVLFLPIGLVYVVCQVLVLLIEWMDTKARRLSGRFFLRRARWKLNRKKR